MTFRQGDIIAYTPQHLFRRDGYAEVLSEWSTGALYGRDTFDLNDTRLTAAELATGKVLFSLDEFEEHQYLDEAAYAADDVVSLATRKGIVTRTFLRRGAQQLTEAASDARRQQAREQLILRARRHLLSPADHQDYVQTPLPEMSAAEVTELADTLQWCERARRAFDSSFDHLVGIVSTGNGSLNIQTVHADEAHYELVRARRALDKKLSALRG